MTAQPEAITGAGPQRHYSRISLELSHTWPGELYLRFETGPKAAVMVAVTPGDLAALRTLIPEGARDGQ